MSFVRHGLVLAGLIITKFFGAAIGISAFATAELYGPTMPRNLLSSSICRTLATPASALYAPCRQSSKLWYVMVKPSTVPFCWIANLTPFAVAWPPMVHTGRSEPILMVPLLVPPPVLPPQAKATRVAAVRTISPLARTIWFPLCAGWEGNAQTTPNASHHLPPSSQPRSGRECAGGECGHMGWPNCYSEANYRLGGPHKSSRSWEAVARGL